MDLVTPNGIIPNLWIHYDTFDPSLSPIVVDVPGDSWFIYPSSAGAGERRCALKILHRRQYLAQVADPAGGSVHQSPC